MRNLIFIFLAATIVSAGESQAQVVLGEHMGSEVVFLSFSADGTSLISLTNSDVKIWDTVANNLIQEFPAPPALPNSVVVSPDGKWLAVNRLLFDMESKRVSGPLGSAFVYAAVFIDSKVLRVLTTDIAVTTWDVEKRELLSTVSLAGGLDRIEVGGVSPDGKLVAFGSRGTRDGSVVRIWNTETGAIFHTLEVPDQGILSFQNSIGFLAFSSDGVLAYVTASSEKINLFDLETKESIATLEAEDEVTSLTFTQGGGLLATGLRDGSISLWDVETQELVFTDKSHEDDVTALAFSSDGAKLASGGGPFDNKVVLWDIAGVIQKIEEQKKNVAVLLGHATNRDISSVAFSPVENLLASCSRDGTIRFWNTDFPRGESIVLTREGFEVTSVAFSVDGKVLASGSEDNTFSVWDVASKERIANVFGDGRGELNSVSFSPDGKLLATGRNHNRIEIWSADIRTYNQIEGVTTPSLAILGEYERNLDVDVVAFADGKILAALYDTGNVTVWNVEIKAVVETIDLPGNISAIVFTPDGKTLVMGGSGGVTFWDMESRRVSVSWELAEMSISSVAVSRDGSTLATGGVGYRKTKIKLWDIATRDSIALPGGLPEGDVYSVAFSPTGQRLAMGLEDGVLVLANISEDAPPLTGGTPPPPPPPPPPSPDFDGNGVVDFSDFLQFVAVFGSRQGDPNYDAKYDLDSDGAIDFDDFLTFVNAFHSG